MSLWLSIKSCSILASTGFLSALSRRWMGGWFSLYLLASWVHYHKSPQNPPSISHIGYVRTLSKRLPLLTTIIWSLAKRSNRELKCEHKKQIITTVKRATLPRVIKSIILLKSQKVLTLQEWGEIKLFLHILHIFAQTHVRIVNLFVFSPLFAFSTLSYE